MADNLTVRTGTGEGAPGGEVSGGKEVDRGRGELDKLREVAKSRHGKHLDDKTLAAIAARRKAKLAHEQRISASKTTFESVRGRESVTAKATERETQAQKATGTPESRGADGLTEQERTSVRSDPKAGPRLPPTDSKATTPEQASGLLQAMSSLLLTDGKAFDVQAYAKTLKPKPAEQPKAPATRAQAPAPSVTAQKATMTARPGPGALPRESSRPTAGLGAPLASAKLSFRATQSDTALGRTGATNDGLINAGGGLVTGTRFDGMHFNWDAFFSLFLIRSQEDLNLWRRLMKELDAAQGELSLQGRDVQMALTKMRQAFGRLDANLKLQTSLDKAKSKLQQGPVYELLGGNQAAVPALRGQLAGTARAIYARAGEKAASFVGRTYLSDADLEALGASPELKEAYKQALGELRRAGGDLAKLGLIMDDRAQVRAAQAEREKDLAAIPRPPTREDQQRIMDMAAELGDLAAADERLGVEIDRTRAEMSLQVAVAASSPEVAAYLNSRRNALSDELSRVRSEQGEISEELEKANLSADDRTKLDQKLKAAQEREESLLRQIVVLDPAIAEHDTQEQKAAYEKLLAKAEDRLAAANKAQAEYRAAVQAVFSDRPGESNADRVARLELRQADLGVEHGKLRVASEKSPDDRALRGKLSVNESLQEIVNEEIQLSGTDASARTRSERLNLARNRQDVPQALQNWASSAGARADRLHHLIRGDADHQTSPEGSAVHAGAHVDPANVWAPYDPNYRKRLWSAVEAGNQIAEVRAEQLPDPNAQEFHENVRNAMRTAAEGPMVSAVDGAVQNAISLAQRHRKELDAMLRGPVQQAQGMINQLIQLLGMSRAR